MLETEKFEKKVAKLEKEVGNIRKSTTSPTHLCSTSKRVFFFFKLIRFYAWIDRARMSRAQETEPSSIVVTERPSSR